MNRASFTMWLLYPFITPFYPNWTYAHYRFEEKKKIAAIGCLLVAVVLYLLAQSLANTPKQPIYVLAHIIRAFSILLSQAWLLMVIATKLGGRKLTWLYALSIVSFSTVPKIIDVAWAGVDIDSTHTISVITMLWRLSLWFFGLIKLQKTTWIKAALTVFLVELAFRIFTEIILPSWIRSA